MTNMLSKADEDLIASVISAIRSVIPDEERAALHEPEFAGHEWDYVKSCIDDGWVSSAGAFVTRFENDLAQKTGVQHAVACVNGTAALHAALLVAGVQPQDEVIVPSLTFVATANAVSHAAAIPHFVDCETETLGMCPKALDDHLTQISMQKDGLCINRETGRIIRAIVPVHVFGHPAKMQELCRVAEAYGLVVIEDATEALGSLQAGKPVGAHGRVSVLSFNGNKIITTGGGGALLTNDEALATRARHLTTTAKLPHRWAFNHDEIGYNYRMPNINAALGCAQLEKLDDFVQHKRRLADAYAKAFADVEGVTFIQEQDGTTANYWLQAILLDEERASLRDPLLNALNEAGLQSRPVWTPMHQLPYQTSCPRAESLAVTESISERLINIPSSPKLGDV